KILKPLIDFDRDDTDYFKYGTYMDNDNGFDDLASNDTRNTLHKKVDNFYNIIHQIGGKLHYIKSGTTGHTFKGVIQYDPNNENDKKYLSFLTKYKQGEFHDQVSILLSEWANRGDLLDYIRKNYKRIQLMHWKIFFFQIISTLAVIQSKFPSFRHNDLKANNILLHKISRTKPKFTYTVLRKKYIVPNLGYSVKLWDFDFACIPGVIKNVKVELQWTKPINVTPKRHQYYDIHYFFNTLAFTGFFPRFMTSNYIHDEVKEFVKRVIPEQYRSKLCTHKLPPSKKDEK